MTMAGLKGAVAVAAALSVVAMAGETRAEYFETGNSLLEKCKSGMSGAVNCLGYVTGIADAMAAGNSVNNATACFPKDVTPGKVQDLVIDYLEKNPDKRGYAAAGLVSAALHESFPCPR